VLPLLMFSFLMATPANPMHGEPMRPLPIPGLQDVIEYLPPGAVGPERAPHDDLLVQAAAAARAHPESSFRYPSLEARCANGVAPLVPNPDSRLVMTAPQGCRVAVKRLPSELIGIAISLSAWLAIAGLGLWRSGKLRRQGTARGRVSALAS